MKRATYIVEAVLQLLVGIGAVPVGLAMIISPDGSLVQMSTDMLAGSPLSSFVIPGILLLLINGAGNIVSSILCFRRMPAGAFTAMVLGFALIIWIYVQVSWLGAVSWLQPLYFAVGVAILALEIVLRELEVGIFSSRGRTER